MQDVAIVITQNGIQVGSTLYTNAAGQAFTTLSPGNYTATFSATGRSTVTTNFSIVQNDNYMIFVYPDTSDAETPSVTAGVYAVSNDGLYQWDGVDTWDLRTLNTYPLKSIVELNGTLYAGAADGILYEWNADNQWIAKTEALDKSINILIVFNNKLYTIITYVTYGETVETNSVLYEWTVNTLAFVPVTEDINYTISSLVVYDNTLYGVTFNPANLVEWTGEAWSTTISTTTTSSSSNAVVFNDKIYATSMTYYKLYEFNPATETFTQYNCLTVGSQPYLLIVFNNKLYVHRIGYATLFEWEGGATFTQKVSRAGSSITGFAINGSLLYAVTSEGHLLEWDGGESTIWALKAMGIGGINAAVAVES